MVKVRVWVMVIEEVIEEVVVVMVVMVVVEAEVILAIRLLGGRQPKKSVRRTGR